MRRRVQKQTMRTRAGKLQLADVNHYHGHDHDDIGDYDDGIDGIVESN